MENENIPHQSQQTLRRTGFQLGALAIALVAFVLWAWSNLDAHRQAAINAGHDLLLCRRLALQIKQMRDKPMIAGSHEREMTELSRQIEQTALSCQIPSSSLVRISPDAARRWGDSTYLEKPTTILLSGVTLKALAQFLYLMSTGSAAMDVRTVRLSAPREQNHTANSNEIWTAEVSLSYLIYAPRSDSPSVREEQGHTAGQSVKGEL